MKLDCQAMDERLVDYLYDELEPKERALVEAHLVVCPGCTEQVRSMSSTRSLMADLAALSPSRDDSYVMGIAAAQARKTRESRGLLGALAGLGRWLGEHPTMVALPVAASVLVIIVGINLADGVRDLLGASADALAGNETSLESFAPGQEAFGSEEKAALEGYLGADADEAPRREAEPSPVAPEPVGDAPAVAATDRRRASGLDRDSAMVEPPPQRPAASPPSPPARRSAPAQSAPRSEARQSPALPPPQPLTGGEMSSGRAVTRSEVVEQEFRHMDEAAPPPARAVGSAAQPQSTGPAPEAAAPQSASASRDQASVDSLPAEVAMDDHLGAAVVNEPASERSTRMSAAPAREEGFGESLRGARRESRARRAEERERRSSLEDARRMVAEGRCEEVVVLLRGFSSSAAEAMAEAQVLLARCLQRLGRDDEARGAWRAAAEASPQGHWGDVARAALAE